MIRRLLFILFLVAMPEILHGQRVAYSTYPVANEFSVNNQLCCDGARRWSKTPVSLTTIPVMLLRIVAR